MLTSQDVRACIEQSVTGVDMAKIEDDLLFFDCGLDSLDHANILLALSEQHGLDIPDEHVDECNSVNAILLFAQRQHSSS